MIAKKFLVMLFYFMCNNLVCAKKIEEIFTCINETECDEVMETAVEGVYNSTSIGTSSTAHSTQTTNINAVPTMQTPQRIKHSNEARDRIVYKIESDVCECDLTTSSCNINCCCDKDCNDFHLTVFSHCENHQAELFDKRYCYNRNFIQRNNTPFVLEKLANNLFCILYDNLPPTYSINNDLDIKTEKDIRETMKPNRLTWQWADQIRVPEYNTSSPYQDGDVIWKIHNNYIKPFGTFISLRI